MPCESPRAPFYEIFPRRFHRQRLATQGMECNIVQFVNSNTEHIFPMLLSQKQIAFTSASHFYKTASLQNTTINVSFGYQTHDKRSGQPYYYMIFDRWV